VSHRNLWAGVSSVTRYLELGSEDRLASLLPFSFDYGLSQLLMSVACGATLIIERSPLAGDIAATLAARDVSVLAALPPLWMQLLASSRFRSNVLPHLRIMTNTGGRLPLGAVRALRESQPHAKLYLMYGLTEAFRSTYLEPREVDTRPGSIGKAIPGAEVLVLRPDGTRCDPGEEGELVHRGPTVALGYWNDPEATSKVFRPNPTQLQPIPSDERVVFSGDYVRLDALGFLYFVGRRDRMIKSLGVRVSPDEVVSAIYDSGEVIECALSTEHDIVRGDVIIAHVVLRAAQGLERLKRFCRVELARHLQPAKFVVHETLPRTASGKHDSVALQNDAEAVP
jgi:acyl-coenzyme A synthetase/AMP-(fatty) acid ligase